MCRTAPQNALACLVPDFNNILLEGSDINDQKETSFFDMLGLVKQDEEGTIGRKFALVRMFLALMFLSTGNKISLYQDEEFQDFKINIK